MPRQLAHTVSTKLSSFELNSLRGRAQAVNQTPSEYLRRLVLADQEITEDRLLRTVEAEHTRLLILTAQQGKDLNASTVRELRAKATTSARALVEQTLRLVRQM
jgi:hypothetical protein